MPPSPDASLAVALGANRPSAAGPPRETLINVRPQLEAAMVLWAGQPVEFRWSGLWDTAPVGPVDQPRFLNAVVVAKGITSTPSAVAALRLLDQLQDLEQQYGRDRVSEERWGPRPLDLDLLFWGEWRLDSPQLVLPHPRLHLRCFVMEPLLQAMQTTTSWD